MSCGPRDDSGEWDAVLAAAYFKIVFAGPFAIYLIVVMVREFLADAGRSTWSHLLIGVVTRVIYAGIFTALCVDGVRYVRARRRLGEK